MEKDVVKNWLMSESYKCLKAFKANPNTNNLAALREMKARFKVEIRMIDRKILESEDESDDSMF